MRPFKQGESPLNLIRQALPDFVEADYPLFVEFVSAFIRFLDQQRVTVATPSFPDFGAAGTIITTTKVGGPLNEARHVLDYRDASTTIDEFISHFIEMYGKSFPHNSFVTPNHLVQSLRQFYASKGTQDSIKWFFRVLFNEDSDVYFPREDILRASDGTWSAPTTLKVSQALDGQPNSDVFKFYVGQRIQSDTGTALVENIITTLVGQNFNQNIIVNELFLKQETILGSFFPNQVVWNLDSVGRVRTRILPVITDLIVNTGGSNYTPGDVITFSEGPSGGQGYGAFGSVKLVSNSSIASIDVISPGDGYITGLPVTFTSTTGTGAKAEVAEVIYGDLELEDGAFFLSESQSADATDLIVLEDKNTLDVELLITPFVLLDAGYADQVRADTPTAYWRLNESSGLTANDTSGNGHTLTLPASGITYSVAGALADGTTGFATGGTVPRVSLTAIAVGTTCSFELWFRPVAGAVAYTLIAGASGGGTGLYFNSSTMKLNLQVGGGGAGDRFNSTALTAGTLYHVVVSVSAGTATFYVNGVADGTGAGWPGVSVDALFNVGSGGGAFVTSLVDEIAIYSYALTANQVTTHYGLRTSTNPDSSGVLLNDADYGISADVPQMTGVKFDSTVDIALAAVNTKPFMHPWVFTNALQTTASLANASASVSVTTNTFFSNTQNVFVLTDIFDTSTTLNTANITAATIVSDITAGNNVNLLYLQSFTGFNRFDVGAILKADGNGVLQLGTITTNGTSNIVGTGTLFTQTVKGNTHIRLQDGSHLVVKSVVNNTFLSTYTTAPANLVTNTYAIVPVGRVDSVTFQAQRFYGKIKSIRLLSNGQKYLTPPAVDVDSVSARAQQLFYLESAFTNSAHVVAASDQIRVFQRALLVPAQNAGQIVKVNILSSGVNYTDPDHMAIEAVHGQGRMGTSAVFTPVIGAVTKYPGIFTTSRGFLSSDKYIQDATYYNDFTYVVRVAESFDRYKDILLKLIHPAGFKLLGAFVLVLEATLDFNSEDLIPVFEPISRNQLVASDNLYVMDDPVFRMAVEMGESADIGRTRTLAPSQLGQYPDIAPFMAAKRYYTSTDYDTALVSYGMSPRVQWPLTTSSGPAVSNGSLLVNGTFNSVSSTNSDSPTYPAASVNVSTNTSTVQYVFSSANTELFASRPVNEAHEQGALSVWFKPKSLPTAGQAFIFGDDNWLNVRVGANGHVYGYVGNNVVKGLNPVSLDQWNHLAVSFKGIGFDTLRMYINGQVERDATYGTYAQEVAADAPLIWYRLDDTEGYGQAVVADTPNGWWRLSEVESYASAVRGDAAIRYWRCNDAQGSTLVDSINANTATATGNVVMGQVGVLAVSDQAIRLDGNNAWVNTAVDLSAFTTAWSIELWVKPTALGGYILHDAETQILLGSDGSSSARFFNGTTAYPINAPAGTFNVGNWSHVVFKWTGGTTNLLEFFVNGANVAAPVTTTGVSGAGDFIKIGKDETTSSFGAFYADEIAFYNYSISAVTIANHYALRLSTLTGTSTTTLLDSTGKGNNVTRVQGIALGSNNTPMLDSTPAIQFDGTDAAKLVVPVGTTATINNTSAISLEMWFNTSTLSAVNGHRMMMNFNAAGASYMSLQNTSVGVLRPFASLFIGGVQKLVGALEAGSNAQPVTSNTWYHQVCTYDGANVKLYINGVLIHSIATTGTLTVSGSLLLGGYSGNGYGWLGYLKGPAVYNYALTAGQIANHYALRLSGINSNTVPTVSDTTGLTTGTITGGVALQQTPALSKPLTWGASFDGATSFIQIPDRAELRPGAGDYSIEAWVKRAPGATQSEFVYAKGFGGGITAAELFIGSTGAFDGRVGNTNIITSPTGYNDGNYHHVVLSVSRASNGNIYVDGTLVGTANIQSETVVLDATNPLYIGRRETGNFLNGSIDEFALYNKALSAARVTAHYAARLDASRNIATNIGSGVFLPRTLTIGSSNTSIGNSALGLYGQASVFITPVPDVFVTDLYTAGLRDGTEALSRMRVGKGNDAIYVFADVPISTMSSNTVNQDFFVTKPIGEFLASDIPASGLA
jgi:hypothetical protein